MVLVIVIEYIHLGIKAQERRRITTGHVAHFHCISIVISMYVDNHSSAQVLVWKSPSLKYFNFQYNCNGSVPAGNFKLGRSVSPRAVRGSELLIFQCFYR